jgi:hypothetical protein
MKHPQSRRRWLEENQRSNKWHNLPILDAQISGKDQDLLVKAPQDARGK